MSAGGRPYASNFASADQALSRGAQPKEKEVRIFIFKSEAGGGLQAFAGDPAGSKLPRQHGPWHATGVIRDDKAPPHSFSRAAIEKAIDEAGFQLWRMKS
ncbi:MAG TPA: hypothetical protein VGL31_05680 [Xanthobacteraceae bacterium]